MRMLMTSRLREGANEMAMSGTEIYHNFNGGSSAALQTASDTVNRLADDYLEEAQAISALQERMNGAWTGGSGEAATAVGADPLARAFQDSAGPLDTTKASLQAQSDAFEQSKSNVVPVPPAPSKPSPWSLGLKAAIPLVGPSMAASNENSYEEGISRTNAANENNIRVMDQYTSMTGATRGDIPLDYKVLPVDGAPVGLSPLASGQLRTGGHPGPDSGRGQTGVPVTPVSAEPPGTNSGRTSTSGLLREEPLPSGGTPAPADPATGRGSTSSGLGPYATLAMHTPATTGDGARRGLDGGRSSGAGGFGDALAGEPDTGRRAARAASAMPVGAAGQHGEEENAEHNRPAFLIEPDPDALFGDDRCATTPVIGE